MAADPRDLCTLAQVRAARGTTASDTTQDTLVQDFITDASVLIMSDYGQEFAPANTTATRKFLLHGGEDLVNLWPYSLQSATTVVLDSDLATTITLATTDYKLRPTPPRDGIYDTLDLLGYSGISSAANPPDREVSITGTWGYPTVPLEAKRACITTVVHWLNVNTATFPHADDSPDSMAPPKRGIPNEAREMLARFKRVWVG